MSGLLEFVDFKVLKVGSPTGRVWVSIYATDGTTPTGSALKTSDKLDVSLISTSAQVIRFVFRDPQSLTSGTTYAAILEGDWTIDGVNAVNIRVNSVGGYASGGRASFDNGGGTWGVTAGVDLWFKTYVTQNDTSVTMPSGYDQKAKVGYVYNDSGSDFDPFVAQDHSVHTLIERSIGSMTETVATLRDVSVYLPPGRVKVGLEMLNTTAATHLNAVAPVPNGYGLNFNPGDSGAAAFRSDGIVRAFAGFITTEYQAVYTRVDGGNAESRVLSYEWGSSGGADVAEEYLVNDDSVVPGDIVSLTDQKYYIEKASASSSYPVFGIVSTKPGLILKDWSYNPQNTRNVALSGRVPVKISEENGIIMTGDRLTLSKTLPGYAMKMTEPGESIGIALESSGGKDKILTFINLTYWIPSVSSLTNFGNTASSSASSSLSFKSSSSTSPLDNLMSYVVRKFKDALGIVFEQGLVRVANIITENITANLGSFNKVDTKELCVDGVCVTKDQFKKVFEQTQNIPTSDVNIAPTSDVTEPTSDVTTSTTSEVIMESTPEPSATPEPTPEPEELIQE